MISGPPTFWLGRFLFGSPMIRRWIVPIFKFAFLALVLVLWFVRRWISPLLLSALLAATVFLWIFSYYDFCQLHFSGPMRRDFDSLRGKLYFQSYESAWPGGRPPPFSYELARNPVDDPSGQPLTVENKGANFLGFRWGEMMPDPHLWWFLAIPWWSIALIFGLMCLLSWRFRGRPRLSSRRKIRAFPVETSQPKAV
jgi:hypothetical protein